jgi:hypothetical protein
MGSADPTMIADRLNRLVKLAIDTGEAETIEEAQRLFSGYRLTVSAGCGVANSATHQAALLTIVNTGRRCVLGGVEIAGVADAPLLVPFAPFRTLAEAVTGLGGKLVDAVLPDAPLIVVGDGPANAGHGFAVRTTFEGWAGGIVPLSAETLRLDERREFVPSGVVAGALAVAEAFQHLRESQPAAGRRSAGLSLWRPELDWREGDGAGPDITRLPSALWLIGLGNLGQAYLWTLGLLPYADPTDLHLVLQDFDVLAESNDSTSLLTQQALVGQYKTRAMAHWAERRGFKTAIVERRFAADFRAGTNEPNVALCGVDNALARSALEDVGFGRIIEAGLGGGTSDFLGFRTHVFPGARKARDIWRDGAAEKAVRLDLPAYRSLAATGADRCGLSQLAGRTVGAPFVGAIAGAAVVGELLRLVSGAHGYDLLDGHLKELGNRTVVRAQELPPFNPGSTESISNL